jgi:2-C-methyl-D-erythritol 4-phosphate cytidylyltransferase
MTKKFALIVAGGSGNRMNTQIPKQFLEIEGKPVLMYTFEAFASYDAEIKFILVLPASQFKLWQQLCEQHQFPFQYKLAHGGENRFQSVKNGLQLIEEEGIVFIHDGVRPLVSKQTICNCYETTIQKGNALPVIPPSESIRYSNQNENKAVDRSKYFLVQTPQTFHVEKIKEAYQMAKHENFTDDASVMENDGEKINLVDGNRENIKITYPQDLIVAKSFLFPHKKTPA